MPLYDKVLEDIVKKQGKRQRGEFNGIPIPWERYSKYLDGFNPGDYIGLLGMTGSAKSRLLRYWMYHMVDFIMQNDYPCKILYFGLEDPEIPVGKKILSHYLYTRAGISVGPKILNSRETPISESVINAIKKDESFYRQFDSIVEVINELTSPNQIYTKVAETYKELGSDFHLIVMLDNQSNITRDKEDLTEWDAIKRLSRDIIRLKFCKAGITTITVLQTDSETEKNTFRNAGKGSIINLEPNLASIADAKVVARSMHFVFGLFDPWRFEIKEYPYSGDYNIDILRGRSKFLLHLKSNEEEIAPRFGLLFDGRHELFEPLPLVTDKDALDKLYRNIIEEERMRKEKFLKLF